jgi:hypothetical protein
MPTLLSMLDTCSGHGVGGGGALQVVQVAGLHALLPDTCTLPTVQHVI